MHDFRIYDSERRLTPLGTRSGTRMVPRGTVLFIVRGMSLKSEFRAGITMREVAFGQDCKALLPKGDVDALFLAHALRGAEHRVLRLVDEASHGTGRLDMSLVSCLPLFMPVLAEQRRLAAILETIDEAISGTEQVIAKLQQMKQGLLYDLLTRGIDENGELRDPERFPEQFKGSPSGPIPKSWEVGPLGQVLKAKRGASPRPITDPKWFASSGPGWVRIGDVSASNGILTKTTQYLSPAGARLSVPVRQGHVIMSIAATVGLSVIVGMDACIHDGFVRFDDHEASLRAEFLVLLLQHLRRAFVAQGQTGTQANINSSIVESTLAPRPSIAEQERILDRVHAAAETIRLEQQELEKLRSLKDGLMGDLLTGRVRVTLEEPTR